MQTLLRDIDSMRSDDAIADVRIKVGDRTFATCRALLVCRSPFFRKLFAAKQQKYGATETEMSIVSFGGETPPRPDVFAEVMNHIHAAAPNISSANVLQLAEAANFFEMPELCELCLAWVDATGASDAADIFAVDGDATPLGRKALAVLLRRPGELFALPQWRRLSADAAVAVLGSDEIRCGEAAVLSAAMDWVNANGRDERVAACIRPLSMTLSEVATLLAPSGLIPAERLLQCVLKMSGLPTRAIDERPRAFGLMRRVTFGDLKSRFKASGDLAIPKVRSPLFEMGEGLSWTLVLSVERSTSMVRLFLELAVEGAPRQWNVSLRGTIIEYASATQNGTHRGHKKFSEGLYDEQHPCWGWDNLFQFEKECDEVCVGVAFAVVPSLTTIKAC
jgi:hypothetical protein